MSVLARAASDRIDSCLQACAPLPSYQRIRGPEVGLMMVRGRAGGSGAPFNFGEMTVTRCTLRTETGHVGHAYVAGRHERRAELAALVDALMQDADRMAEIECSVIEPLAATQNDEREERSRQAAATRVQFFAMQTMRT
jgi:alpha-D-ribose 1-methylphosphonate 5-triphosphate synthase subunit PhnG